MPSHCGKARRAAARPAAFASLVEEAVHPRDAGRDDPLLRDPERLGVERDVVGGAHDRGGVVLVDPREPVRVGRRPDPAVADGLERAGRVPQLDDPDRRSELDPVQRRIGVVDEDDLGPGQRAGQPHPTEQPALLAGSRLEHRDQVVVAVEAALDHPVVDGLQVARHLRDEGRREEHLPAGRRGRAGRPPRPAAGRRPAVTGRRSVGRAAGSARPASGRARDGSRRRTATSNDSVPAPGSRTGVTVNSRSVSWNVGRCSSSGRWRPAPRRHPGARASSGPARAGRGPDRS